jgi:hypothetical protein
VEQKYYPFLEKVEQKYYPPLSTFRKSGAKKIYQIVLFI